MYKVEIHAEGVLYTASAETLKKCFMNLKPIYNNKNFTCRTYAGKWIKAYSVVITKNGRLVKSHYNELKAKIVASYQEDYWCPDSITIYLQSNGLYTIMFEPRRGERVYTQNVNLFHVWNRMKRYCSFNHIKFKGFNCK